MNMPKHSQNVYSSLLLLTRDIYKTCINNTHKYTSHVRRLQYLFTFTQNECKLDFDSLCKRVQHTKILYTICTEDKIYIGQTKDFYARFKQHSYHIRNVLKGKKHKNPTINTTKNSNKPLYKHTCST